MAEGGRGLKRNFCPLASTSGAGEAGIEEGERLVRNASPRPPVDAEGLKLRRHPADARADDQAIAAEFLDRRDLLGRRQRCAVGQNQDGEAQGDARRDPGEPGERRQGVHIAPAAALGVVWRDGEVIGSPDRFDPGRLGGERAGGHRPCRRLAPARSRDHPACARFGRLARGEPSRKSAIHAPRRRFRMHTSQGLNMRETSKALMVNAVWASPRHDGISFCKIGDIRKHTIIPIYIEIVFRLHAARCFRRISRLAEYREPSHLGRRAHPVSEPSPSNRRRPYPGLGPLLEYGMSRRAARAISPTMGSTVGCGKTLWLGIGRGIQFSRRDRPACDPPARAICACPSHLQW